MEYVQMTLTDWMEAKHRLKMELQGVKQSFVRIGFMLRKIDDQKLYEQDGYKSVAEFAKSEYGLEASTVSRFMSINREYSIDGYSEHLREEYLDLSRSQLEEMLKLPEADRSMIQPETARDDIRELKKFNKAEPVAGVADDIVQLIEKFYEENPEILNELFSEPETGKSNLKRCIEIANPSGSRSYKKGLFFLMMYENKIVIKKFGGTPEEMTWERFFEITFSIFESSANGPKTWEKHFGKELEPVAVQEEKGPEKIEEKPVKNEIARAQKTQENQGLASDLTDKKEVAEKQIPGQMEAANYPQMMPEAPAVAEEEENGLQNGLPEGNTGIGNATGACGCVHEVDDGETGGAEAARREPETPQSNEESGISESKEYQTEIVESEEELETWIPKRGDELELKPCPFCGNENIMYIKYRCVTGERYRVTCGGCVATIDPGYAQQMSIVQEMWNRRVSDEKHLT